MPKGNDIELNHEEHPFLKEGVYKVEYFSSKEVTQKDRKLLQKLSRLLSNNTKTQQIIKEITEVDKPKFHSTLGIDRKEYESLINLLSHQPAEKQNGILTITRNENEISFIGKGQLSLLDSVTLNIINRTASFKQYKMSRINDSIDLPKEYLPPGDTLDGFEFYKGPDGILGLMGYEGLEGVYELLIGELKPSGRKYLFFFARQPHIIEHPIPEHITVIIDDERYNTKKLISGVQ
jgi:hypothetical protein